MTIDDIRKIIAPNEHRELELKKTTGELKDAMHSACAFLNTDGGWLIFGIAPTSLNIVGQEVTDNTQREMANALSGFEPAVNVRVEYVDVPEHPGNKVIAINFDGWVWGKEPYTYHGCPYIRVESTTKQMLRQMFEERLKAAKPHKFGWEKQVADDYTVDDLDENRIRAAVKFGVENGRISPTAQGATIETILEKLNLMKQGMLTNAAVMLFAKNTSDYPQLLVRLARFKGTDKLEFIDNKRVKGNFFDLLDASMEFAYRHLNISGKIVGLHREDRLEIPIPALREALVNALCHRVYDNLGASVGFAIYDDRVEIENPGRFPEGLTTENIKESHKSLPYNQLVAEVLYKTSWLESWGTGVRRMCDECLKYKIPEPYYEIGQGFVTIIFKKGASASESCVSDCRSQLSDRQCKILDFIDTNNHITASQIAEALHISVRTVSTEISVLRSNGYIEKSSKDNKSPWVVLKKS